MGYSDIYEIVEPSVSQILVSNPYKMVELCARICYKTENKITDTSCYGFVDRLTEEEHYAILEHGRMTFVIEPAATFSTDECTDYNPCEIYKYFTNIPAVHIKHTFDGHDKFYVNFSLSHLVNKHYRNMPIGPLFDLCNNMVRCYYLQEGPGCSLDEFGHVCGIWSTDKMKYVVRYLPEGSIFDTSDYRTYKFVCDRGVSHELVRHRCSIAQESQRYCNYTLGRFDGKVKFVLPSNWDNLTYEEKYVIKSSFECAAENYNKLIKYGMKPQMARSVLTNAVKTEVIMTMPYKQWQHFLDIRYRGTAGSPHPDMVNVAKMLNDIM